MNKILCASVVSVFAAAGFGQAVNVGPATVTPLGTNWYTPAGENTGGGAAFINGSYSGIDADGSMQITGDRSRIVNGNMYPSAGFPGPNLGLASGLSRLSFDWTVTSQGSGVQTAQAPVLRVILWSATSNRRYDIVWEDGEQVSPSFVNGAGSFNTIYTGDFFGANSRVYARTGGFGDWGFRDGAGNMISGSTSHMSIGTALSLLPSDTIITGLSLGVGSSVGAGFTGYADHVDFAVAGGIDTTMNFIPTPGAAALLGLGGLAASRRRRA